MVRQLSTTQLQALRSLVAARRLDAVPVDEARAERFIELARATLVDVTNVRLPQNKYNLAYDAAHAVGESLLARFGYRTTSGPGSTKRWPVSCEWSSIRRLMTGTLDTSTGCAVPVTRCTTTRDRLAPWTPTRPNGQRTLS